MSVIFDQLRISDDGKKMYISAHVNKAAYFDNVYIDSITILTEDQVSETNPHTPETDYVYKQTFDVDTKEFDIMLQPVDFNEHFDKTTFSKNLFFVYIKVYGVPDPCTPCGMDEEYTVGVTFDESLLYQAAMGYTKELLNDCSVHADFINFILQWKMFNAAIETKHWIPAIKFWNILFNGKSGISANVATKSCGCHG